MGMSDDTDSRLSAVERALGAQGQEQARQGARLDAIERDIGGVKTGIEKLLQTQASTPQPLSWKTAGATLMSVASAGAVIWGIIAMSPAVGELRDNVGKLNATLDKRLTEVDGRYGRLEHLEAEHRRMAESAEKLATLNSALDKRLSELDGKSGRLSQIEAEQRRTTEALGWRPTIARSQ